MFPSDRVATVGLKWLIYQRKKVPIPALDDKVYLVQPVLLWNTLTIITTTLVTSASIYNSTI